MTKLTRLGMCRSALLLGVLSLSVAGCARLDGSYYGAVSTAMTAALPNEFAQLSFAEYSTQSGMQPALVFEGRHSKILATNRPMPDKKFVFLDSEVALVRIDGLAATNNGRYFTFTYLSDQLNRGMSGFFGSPCLERGCRSFDNTRQISRRDAMEWFFNSDDFTPARFKELFGEDAPPKEVQA